MMDDSLRKNWKKWGYFTPLQLSKTTLEISSTNFSISFYGNPPPKNVFAPSGNLTFPNGKIDSY